MDETNPVRIIDAFADHLTMDELKFLKATQKYVNYDEKYLSHSLPLYYPGKKERITFLAVLIYL